MKSVSRREILKASAVTLLGGAGVAALSGAEQAGLIQPHGADGHSHRGLLRPPVAPPAHGADHVPNTIGEVNHEDNGFNPTDILTNFDGGTVTTLPNGQTQREYNIVALDHTVEIVPGIEFPAWTYNGRIPGPTIRATEGDHIRINLSNGSGHPHSMHFHGFHQAAMARRSRSTSGAGSSSRRPSRPTGRSPRRAGASSSR